MNCLGALPVNAKGRDTIHYQNVETEKGVILNFQGKKDHTSFNDQARHTFHNFTI